MCNELESVRSDFVDNWDHYIVFNSGGTHTHTHTRSYVSVYNRTVLTLVYITLVNNVHKCHSIIYYLVMQNAKIIVKTSSKMIIIALDGTNIYLLIWYIYYETVIF